MKKSLLNSIMFLVTLLPVLAMADQNINGMAPEAFYDRFVEAPMGSCADPQDLSFWIMSTEQVRVAKATDGHDVLAQTDIFLHKDHTFAATYTESEILEDLGDGFLNTKQTKKEVSGTWSVNGIELDIGTVATVHALATNGSVSMSLQYKDSSLNASLAGQVVDLYHSLANYGDQTIGQYCNLNQ